MALSRSVPSPGSTGWFPVARAASVGTTPVAVGAAGRPYVVLRMRPGAEITALAAVCPHRLVPLTSATVIEGTVRCAGHGWRFNAEGRCVQVPSLGDDGTPPPRADLGTPWAVEERDGWVWIAPERTLHQRPPRAVPQTTAEPVPPVPTPTGPVFGNLEPALEHSWQPVAPSGDLRDGGWLAVRLLGRTWTLERRAGVVSAKPPARGVRERDGMIWLAPALPVTADLPGGEPGDRTQWLPPLRTGATAAVLLDALLDPARGGRVPTVPDVAPVRGGFTGRWDDDAGRRVEVEVRSPFQLLRRERSADGRAVSLLVLLQPEDADSTRVHARVGLGAGAGRTELADEVARVRAELGGLERAALLGPGLPLIPRDEVHLPTDRLGVALRRALGDLVATARSAADTPVAEEDTDVAAA